MTWIVNQCKSQVIAANIDIYVEIKKKTKKTYQYIL